MCSKLPVKSPNENHIIIAKGDSGATNHCIRPQDEAFLKNTKPNSTIKVTLPNAKAISSTTQGELSLHHTISKQGRNAIILLQLQSSSLISLGQLCDDNCKVHLDKEEMNACKNGKVVLKGIRNKHDGLWDMPLKPTLTEDNCAKPPTHAALYGSNKRNACFNVPDYTRATKPLIKDCVKKPSTKKDPPSSCVPKYLQ